MKDMKLDLYLFGYARTFFFLKRVLTWVLKVYEHKVYSRDSEQLSQIAKETDCEIFNFEKFDGLKKGNMKVLDGENVI